MKEKRKNLSQVGLDLLSEMEQLKIIGGGDDPTRGNNVTCTHTHCVNHECKNGTCSHADCTNGTCNNGYCANGYEIG